MKPRLPQLLAAAAAALSLAACERPQATAANDPAAAPGERVEGAIDRTQQRLAEAGDKTQEALSETGEKLQPKLAAAGDRISEAAGKVAAEVREAVRVEEKGPSSATVGTRGEGPGAVSATVTTGSRTSVSGLPEGTRAAVNDAAITTAVKAGFVKDPGLSALRIDVDTSNGVVVLNGIADDAAARDRAAAIARDVKGVREVRNHLAVKQG
jgi:osmotically-inducible protein OsmY